MRQLTRKEMNQAIYTLQKQNRVLLDELEVQSLDTQMDDILKQLEKFTSKVEAILSPDQLKELIIAMEKEDD